MVMKKVSPKWVMYDGTPFTPVATLNVSPSSSVYHTAPMPPSSSMPITPYWETGDEEPSYLKSMAQYVSTTDSSPSGCRSTSSQPVPELVDRYSLPSMPPANICVQVCGAIDTIPVVGDVIGPLPSVIDSIFTQVLPLFVDFMNTPDFPSSAVPTASRFISET